MPVAFHSCVDTAVTRNARRKLSDQLVKAARPPEQGNYVVFDSQLGGFGIRITASGARAFILNYRFKGRQRRITIGQYPTWTCLAARKQAEHLRRQVDMGTDPLEKRIADREAPTVHDLFERYAVEHLPNKAPRSAADDRAMWAKDILPSMGRKKVADLSADDCDALHRAISAERPIRANRINEVLRKALNLAVRWGWIERNPASGVRRNLEPKRNRYLGRSELAALVQALEAHSNRIPADAILFMLLTGCRKGEALHATWAQFDLERRIWTKPSAETKQRREHRAPYSSAAAEILERRRTEADGTHIFPGSLGAPLWDVRKTWLSACRPRSTPHLRQPGRIFRPIAARRGGASRPLQSANDEALCEPLR